MFSFCKPVSSKKRFLPFREINEHFSFSLYDYADSIPSADWDAITGSSSVFLEKEYLKIIEQAEHTKLMCRYVLVYHKKKVCGIIYFQIVDFKASVFGELMDQQVESLKSRRMNLFERYVDNNKHEVLMRLFTCGNNLVSGEYGFIFGKRIKETEATELLLKITDIVSREEKLRGTISAILIKDFYKPLLPGQLMDSEKYVSCLVEPNLIVTLPKGIDSMNAYLELFSKKYRNRAKAIFKNGEVLEKKILSLKEVIEHEERMYALYDSIFDKAKFKLIKLPKNYFSEVKRLFGEDFTVNGFFLEGKLLAFGTSMVLEGKSLEAHYIGFDYELNKEFDLYQNLLYCAINEGIKHKCKTVNLGRTASEIKTTVGAKPEDLICYIKPQNTISKLILKPFISFLQPAEWIPRNPFKEEGLEKNEKRSLLSKP